MSLKRLISVVLAIALVFGVMQVSFATEGTTSAHSNKEVFVLKTLMVFDDNFDSDSGFVTRSEMAMLTVRLLGVTNEGTYSGGFSDVTSETAYAGYIAHAKSLGIMNGNGADFMPQKFISGNEAVKTLVSALGYDVVASSKGGYPAGYIVCASELGLLNGVSNVSADVISTADVITLLYNALDIKTLEVVYGGDEEYRKSNMTLGQNLEERYNLVLVEGILKAVGESALQDAEVAEEGYIQIGEEVLKANDKELSAYLAYPVVAYADKKGNLAGFCVDNENYSEAVIASTQIDEVSLSEIVYTAENDKEEKIPFALDATFIYNGKILSEPSKDDLEIFCGVFRLVNNDEDKAFEAVFIEESVSVAVESIYEPNFSIYFKTPYEYNGRSSLRFNFDNEDYEYIIKKADGTIAGFNDIKQGMALTLTQSRDGLKTTVILSDTTVSGTVEEYDVKNKKVVISGVSYDLALSENGTPWLDAPLGKSGLFLADCNGMIVGEADETVGDSFAFVSAMSKPSGMAQPRIQLRTSGKSVREEKVSGNSVIVSYKYQNGEVLELDFASKVRFNGIGVSPSEINKNALVDKLIKYKLDSEGKLKTIDTYDSYADRASMNFNAEIISFGGRADRDSFLVASSTKVLCVPNYADSNGDWNQTVKCTDEGSYTVYGAEINPETGIAGAVVIYANMDADALVPIDEDTDISMVVNSSQIFDEEGDAVYRVHILTGNTENYIMTGTNKTAEDATAALRPGDLIRYSTDVDGRIANLELLASVQDLDRFYRANANSTNEEIYGRVTNVEVGKLSRIKNEFVDKITIATNEWLTNGVSYELVRKDGAVMYICNPSAKTVRAATGRDMLGSEQFGVAESSKVFMLVKNNDPQVVVVIE